MNDIEYQYISNPENSDLYKFNTIDNTAPYQQNHVWPNGNMQWNGTFTIPSWDENRIKQIEDGILEMQQHWIKALKAINEELESIKNITRELEALKNAKIQKRFRNKRRSALI